MNKGFIQHLLKLMRLSSKGGFTPHLFRLRDVSRSTLINKGAGFSLVEILVVIAIIGIVLALGLQSLAATIRSSTKTTIFNQVKQSGDLAMETLVRSVRNATDACTRSAPPEILIYPNKVGDCTSATGETQRYRCVIDADPAVNGSIDRVIGGSQVVSNVKVVSCTFTHSNTIPRRITIDFTLAQSGSLPTTSEFHVSIPFRSEVTLRNF